MLNKAGTEDAATASIFQPQSVDPVDRCVNDISYFGFNLLVYVFEFWCAVINIISLFLNGAIAAMIIITITNRRCLW